MAESSNNKRTPYNLDSGVGQPCTLDSVVGWSRKHCPVLSSVSRVDGDRFLGGRVEDKRGAESTTIYSRQCHKYTVVILGGGWMGDKRGAESTTIYSRQ